MWILILGGNGSIGFGLFGGYRTVLDNDNVGFNAGVNFELLNFGKMKLGINYYINDSAESSFEFPCLELGIYLFNNKRIAFAVGAGTDYTSMYFPLNLELRINNKFLLYGDYCLKSNAINVGVQYNFLRFLYFLISLHKASLPWLLYIEPNSEFKLE